MNFSYDKKATGLIAQMETFFAKEIYPVEQAAHAWFNDPTRLWQPWPVLENLKQKARAAGLWNLFLPHEYGRLSGGVSNLEYAPLAEIMGRVEWASEVFNCSAPDSGNMEVLAKFGSPEQQQQWLTPLLAGEIRSAYLMTEPAVASSDATNIETSIRREGSDYVINGLKWWISSMMDPRCRILIVMGKTNPAAPRHSQQSMILVPRDTPGIRVIRNQTVLGNCRSPGGEAEVRLDNVRVPAANLILGEGRGFEIAQGRLGPGRIHHCMRSIGQAQRALELMACRVENRIAFGKKLSEQGRIREDVARSWIEIEMARLLTLKAADAMDRVGSAGARDLIAAIKIVAPQLAQTVTDRAMQAHGAMGLSADTPIAEFFVLNRFLRLADGPDEVHLSQLGKLKINEYNRMPTSGFPLAKESLQ
ncbi:acyl-CoA dehydrogenase family protein [Nevskia ramosa]|uniref:acyl-CoA dehydrogenase family protein n=1 Tax=Nevskia ramosa TaxID=64002 RepID=UPI003D0AA341